MIRGNRGDIASRFAILRAAGAAGAGMSGVFASKRAHLPAEYRGETLDYGPVYNLWPGLKGLRALRRARLALWTGGLDLQDDSSLLKLVHMWIVFASYRLLGLRIVLAMQGAGPLQTRAGRWLASRVMALVHLALIRDRASYDLLAGLTSESRLRLGYDGIFLPGFDGEQPGEAGRSAAESIRTGARGPVIGLNLRLWFHFASSIVPMQFAGDAYRQRAQARMSALVDSLAQTVTLLRQRHDARIVLLSMYEPGVERWEDDLPFLEQIAERFAGDGEVQVLRDDVPILDLAHVFGRFDLMIGTRLHSALIALRAGTPAIHIAYTDKGHSIYRDLGFGDWLIDIAAVLRGGEELADMAGAVLADGEARARVARTVADVVARNDAALRAVLAAAEAP